MKVLLFTIFRITSLSTGPFLIIIKMHVTSKSAFVRKKGVSQRGTGSIKWKTNASKFCVSLTFLKYVFYFYLSPWYPEPNATTISPLASMVLWNVSLAYLPQRSRAAWIFFMTVNSPRFGDQFAKLEMFSCVVVFVNWKVGELTSRLYVFYSNPAIRERNACSFYFLLCQARRIFGNWWAVIKD